MQLTWTHLARQSGSLALCAMGASLALAQTPAKLKVGLMLPYTGTFASLGTAIENGFRQHVNELGGKIAGREVEYFKVDDESEPAKATATTLSGPMPLA